MISPVRGVGDTGLRTALVVTVPEADESVRDIRLAHDPSATLGLPAHITLLFPFAPSDAVDEHALHEVFDGRAAFDFILDRVQRWDDGIVWLHPEPSMPFEKLTRAIWQRWPEYPPYGGIYPTIIPHLTLSEQPIEVDVALPIRSRARAIALVEEAPDGVWSTRHVFPLA